MICRLRLSDLVSISKFMKIYVVKNPFMCRLDQFEPGKQSLCIGIEKGALMKEKVYRCYLGNNRETYYEISIGDAIKIGQEWTSHITGRATLILPIFAFKTNRVEKKIPKKGPQCDFCENDAKHKCTTCGKAVCFNHRQVWGKDRVYCQVHQLGGVSV